MDCWQGRQATCHPGFVEHLAARDRIDDRVVADGNCLTSQGPGTAVEFALALVERLYDRDKRDEVAKPMVV
jgi:4-methyl-5(b-hydroxyethyl)-thiazole monophosphate biosynthesis